MQPTHGDVIYRFERAELSRLCLFPVEFRKRLDGQIRLQVAFLVCCIYRYNWLTASRKTQLSQLESRQYAIATLESYTILTFHRTRPIRRAAAPTIHTLCPSLPNAAARPKSWRSMSNLEQAIEFDTPTDYHQPLCEELFICILPYDEYIHTPSICRSLMSRCNTSFRWQI